MVAGQQERGRVSLTAAQVMQRRVSAQPAVLIRIVWVAVVGYPSSPDGKAVEPQHVEHAHVGHARAEQFRMLGQASADQQATVGATGNSDPARTRPARTLQPARARAKVIKHVLLHREPSAVMPRATVLSAS